MSTIVVDHQLTIYKQPRPVIRKQRESVNTRLFNPESTGVVDRKPLKSLRHTGEARLPAPRSYVQTRCPDRPNRAQVLEIRKFPCALGEQVNAALQPGWNHHRGPECRRRRGLRPSQQQRSQAYNASSHNLYCERIPPELAVYLNRFLYRKSIPNSPFSSRSATADQCGEKAHSTRITCCCALETSVM